MKTKYLAIAAAALALVACDKNNDDLNIDNTKDTPITIESAGVAELTTRAIDENNKLVGTSDDPVTMSVFVTGGSGSDTRYNANNVKWEHKGTDWSTDSPILFEGTGSSQVIYALSPYMANATDGTVTITADGKTDYLVATQTTPLISSVVSLSMTHALAKLVLDPTFGTEVTNKAITSVKVGGMCASGTLDIAGNTWDSGDETTELTMTDNELLVIPMESCTSLPITITMGDNRIFKTTVSLAGVDNKLAAGTLYNITLQIGQDKVTLGDITASSWTSVDGGQLETE